MEATTARGLLRVEGKDDVPFYDCCIERLEYGTVVTLWLDKPADRALSPFAAPLSSLRVPQAVDLQIAGDPDVNLRNVTIAKELGQFVLFSRPSDIFVDPEPRGLWPLLD